MLIKARTVSQCIYLGALLGACPTVNAQDAAAASYQGLLQGSYGMTLSQTCVSAPFLRPSQSGIDPATKTLLVDAEIVSAAGTGVMHFERDRTVTIENGKLTEILNHHVAAGDTPVAADNRFTCNGTYALATTGEITLKFACDVKRDPPVTVTIQPLRLEGFLSRNQQSLTLSLIDGNVQEVTVSVAGQVVQKRDRICVQSVTLARLRAGAGAEAGTRDAAD